jgi:high affinity Mn2+ porin
MFAFCCSHFVGESRNRIFELPGRLKMLAFNHSFVSRTVALRSLDRFLRTLRGSNSLQQNGNELLDSRWVGSFHGHSSGVPVALIGQEGIRCAAPLQRQGKSGAAPATVGGESLSHVPPDPAMQGLGRRRRAATREPGDLPERGYPSDARWARAGRTSAVVTKRFVTRMKAATIMLARILSTKFAETKIAKTAISAALAATAFAVTYAESAKADGIFQTKAAPIPYVNSSDYNWNGFYAGGNLGIAWGQSNWTSGPGLSGTSNLFQTIDTFDEAGSFLAGLQGGYNYVLPNRILLGAEVDASFPAFQTLPVGVNPFGLSTGGTFNFNSPTLGPVSFAETALASGTVRGRIGYAPGHWLFYATGGFAWTYNQQSLTQIATGNNVTPFLWRLGWAAGAGVEVPVARHWTARLEYLFTDYGKTSATYLGTQPMSTDFQLQVLRLGLNYQFGNDSAPFVAPIVTKGGASPEADYLSLHGQSTFVYQGYPTFRSPFLGPNSLWPTGNARETFDLTLFAGLRLWQGAEFWFNPEIDQGHGLADTHGVAGFPSGESYKLGFDYPYARAQRYFVRQTIDLGGEAQKADADVDLFAQSYTANRLVLWVGKFAIVDVFDTNKYANNPKTDFMNWALINAGTFDYAGDAWGYTYGAAAEWYQGIFALRAGLFDLSATPAGGALNAAAYGLDNTFGQQQYVGEIEERHQLWGQPGKLKVTAFLSHGKAGDFADAIALAQPSQPFAGDPSTALASLRNTYRNRTGVSLNLEQQLTETMGMFARAGWADGNIEPWDFTDIDRTVSAGLSINGKNWGRADDTIGVAGIINGLAPNHQAYFAAGGLGILIGDGALPNYGLEQIIETYYSYAITDSTKVTFDYQFIANPAYNADRGPVNAFAGRLHTTF